MTFSNMYLRNFLLVLALFSQTILFAQVKVGESYPYWSEGYMDIHHINTGRGECVFAILPDGTTMLIDAGEISMSSRTTEARPDESKSAGEWITRYINNMMHPLSRKELDYILLTHFHDDHMGDIQVGRERSKKGDYVLSGITEVGDKIPFKKIIDRNWPDYDWPTTLSTDNNLKNYIRFVNWHVSNGVVAEQFNTGSNRQFSLVRQPEKYPEFEIRNIAANGYIWTGVMDSVYHHFASLEQLKEKPVPNENQCSAVLRISYGKFDYFNGGDIVHSNAAGTWRDVETPVGLVTGPVEVCEVNHHAYYDAMGEAFLKAVRPRVFIMQLWSVTHPDHRTLQRLLDTGIYPGERDIFATNMLEATQKVLGRRASQLKSQQGHIVIRVHPGGDSFHVIILDDEKENFTVKAIHGPYESR